METVVFVVAAAIVLAGGFGVVLSRNPVHSALSLVATLFGVAVLFIAQDADFLAAVQVIVYAGAIVVLFLFVIMLLGVDRAEDLETDPLIGQRTLGLIAGGLLGAGLVFVLVSSTVTGAPGRESAAEKVLPNIERLARLVFTDYLFAFEVTSVLLVIAVVGAVLLAHQRQSDTIDADEPEVELDVELLRPEYADYDTEADGTEGDGARDRAEIDAANTGLPEETSV